MTSSIGGDSFEIGRDELETELDALPEPEVLQSEPEPEAVEQEMMSLSELAEAGGGDAPDLDNAFSQDMSSLLSTLAAGHEELQTTLPDLARGSEDGEGVRGLQTALNTARAAAGQAAIPVDGDFGPKTEAALKEFQGAAGLARDGVAEAKTWAALGAQALGGAAAAKDNIALKYGKNARALTSEQETQVKDLLKAAGEKGATITSTARTPEDQARAMYNNLVSKGVKHQKNLYGASGDKVIDVYDKMVKENEKLPKGKQHSPADIKAAMEAKINELGPSKVSDHCAEDGKLVIDIDPGSIKDRKAFEKALDKALKDGTITTVHKPPEDPAYHVEWPKK